MKKLTNYTQDQLARFIARKLLTTVKRYNFDLFYDIKRIVDNLQEVRHISDKPQQKEYFLMLRHTGSDFVQKDNTYFDNYYNNNKEVYRMLFTFNCDYMHNIPFCQVTKIK